MESRLVEITNQTDRYRLKNGNTPNLNRLPLPDRDAMEEFLSNIKLLTGTLGHKFLENPISIKNISEIVESTNNTTVNNITDKKDEIELHLYVSGIRANAIQTNEGLVVLENSEVSDNPTKNYGYGALRESLIEETIIVKNTSGKFYFSKKHLFSSPSAAAVILGYSVNGRNVWKNDSGKSIKEIEKTEIE